MRHDHRHPAGLALGDLDHMADEAIIALGLGRNAAPEPLERIVASMFRAPFVEAEGRVGQHHVKLHQVVAFDQRRAVERVAPFDARGILGVQKHVHPRQRPGRPVHFLPEQREVVRPHLLRCLDKQ